MVEQQAPAALSQLQYLEKQFKKLEKKILRLEDKQNLTSEEIHELYFQKGKLFSEIELMKRIPNY